MTTNTKPIVRILANRSGVYEADVRVPPGEYAKAEQLTVAIQPALAIIDGAILSAYGDVTRRAH